MCSYLAVDIFVFMWARSYILAFCRLWLFSYGRAIDVFVYAQSNKCSCDKKFA
uniref:Uncharacterized protein n=1 Tax=Helianthus annuus TaxID=4232 RepID=A0A251S2U1_HELAN